MALPTLPTLPRLYKPPKRRKADRRGPPRITIQELNERGIQAVREKGIDTALKSKDRRSAFTKVLDWIDLPRNIVARAIGGIVGLQPSQRPKGALGLKRVYMSDILRKLGVKNPVIAAVGGLIGDVLVDPLTYLSAGALTGMRIGKHVPRILKPAQRMLRGVAKGQKPTGALAAALGMTDKMWRRIAAKGATKEGRKWLMGRRGGVLTRMLAKNALRTDDVGRAARQFLKEGGLKGRVLARIPFTQIKTPALRVGKKAGVYKALDISEAGLKQMSLAQKQKKVLALAQSVQQLGRRAADAYRNQGQVPKELAARLKKARKLLQQKAGQVGVSAVGTTREGARYRKGAGRMAAELQTQVQAQLTRPGTPKMVALARQAKLGKPPPAGEGLWAHLRREVREKFGPGPSKLRSQELAVRHGFTMGAATRGTAAWSRASRTLDPIAVRLSKQGFGPAKEIRDTIGYVIDIGGKAQQATYHPTAGKIVQETLGDPKIRAIITDPDVKRFIADYGDDVRKLFDIERKAGVRQAGILDYFARQPTKEAAKAIRGQERRMGGPMGKGFAKLTEEQPFGRGRTKMMELVSPFGRRKMVLETEPDRLKRLVERRWKTVAEAGTPGHWKIPAVRGKMLHLISPGGMRKAVPTTEVKRIERLLDRNWRILTEGEKATTWNIPAVQMQRMVEKGRLRGKVGAEFRGQFWEMDPAKSFATRVAQSEKALAGASLRDVIAPYAGVLTPQQMKLTKYSGLRPVSREIFTKDHPLRAVLGDELLSRAFPIEMTDMLNRMGKSFQGGEQLNQLLRATDMTLGWFKRWALFHPAYVNRNVFQNAFGTMMSGMNPVKAAPWWTGKAGRILRQGVESGAYRTPEWLAKFGKQTVSLSGRKMTYKKLADFVAGHNMAGAGRSVAEFPVEAIRAGGPGAGILRKGGRAAAGLGELVRKGNAAVETKMRLGTWLAFLDDGLSMDDALRKTLTAMPDLSDVTQFERAGLTRLWPWYRWLKNNGALQLFYYLPRQPAWMAGVKKFQNFIEAASPAWREEGSVPEQLRAQWMRQQQAAQFMGGPDEGSAFLLRTWFPFEEVQSLGAGLISPTEMARYWAGSVRPGIKVPFEMATGQDIFRGRKVRPLTTAGAVRAIPKALAGASGTALDNLLAMRPIREYGRRVPEQPTIGGKIARGLLGGAVQPLSKERGLQELDIRTSQEIRQLRRLMVRAKENKDEVEFKELLAQFIRLQIERWRLGLDIPKASEKQLGKQGFLRRR